MSPRLRKIVAGNGWGLGLVLIVYSALPGMGSDVESPLWASAVGGLIAIAGMTIQYRCYLFVRDRDTAEHTFYGLAFVGLGVALLISLQGFLAVMEHVYKVLFYMLVVWLFVGFQIVQLKRHKPTSPEGWFPSKRPD